MFDARIEHIHISGALTHLTTLIPQNAPHCKAVHVSFASTEAASLGLQTGQTLPLAPKQVYVFSQSGLIEYAI